jgi:cupin 2 domain-containing protein
LRLERIVSYGHNSAPGFWYDQEESEWVILLSGSAEIEFANGKIANLHAGDYLLIPAHTKHRVKSTSKKEKSVWLALFF